MTVMTETTTTASLALAQKLFAQNKSLTDIEKQLNNAGFAADEVTDTMTQIRRSHHHRMSNMGMLLIGMGVVLCIVGFGALFCSSYGCTTFNVALYGMTGAGGTSIMGGLFLILG
jgi:hypothetical protein